MLAELGGERPGEAEHGVLGGGVGRRVRRAHMHEGLDRADIDDAALAGAQRLEEGVGDVEHAVDIDRHDVLPVLQHGSGIGGEGVAAVDAGIVDEDRDLPDLVRDLLCDGDAVLAFGDVELEAFRLAAGVADFLRGLGGGLLVDVEQHHARALVRIAGRDGAADAGAGAGDDGDVIGEQRHGVSSRFCFYNCSPEFSASGYGGHRAPHVNAPSHEWRGSAARCCHARPRIASAACRCRRNRCWR